MTQRKSPSRPVAVDLFSGAGGLSLGLEQAGFDVLAAVEYDPVHAATHKFNFPHTEVVPLSVAELSGSDLLEAASRGAVAHGRTFDELDLIAGGPPCQGFSWIGKRRVDDARNDLIFHFWRLVHESRPKYFIMENVPGMKSGAHSDLLEDLVGKLRADGYRVAIPEILLASGFGVPQARRRLFLIGSREDQVQASLPSPHYFPSSMSDPKGSLALPAPTVWDAIGNLPDLDAFEDLLDSDEVALDPELVAAMQASASTYARVMMGLQRDKDDFSWRRKFDATLLTSSARTVHTELSRTRFAATKPGSVEKVSRFLRLDPDGLCNTLRAGTGSEHGAHTSPRPIHPQSPRVISVREAARLHSMPDWFRLHRTKWHGFRQVGNAVPPLLARAVARSVVTSLGAAPTKPRGVLQLGDPMLLSLTMAESREFFELEGNQGPAQRTRGAA